MMDGAISPLARRLPHNVDAEMALLGAVMVNNRAFDRVSDFLRPEHFVLVEHNKIFEACAKLIESGKVADPVTLKSVFENNDSFSAVGGVNYLMRLAECATTIINVGEYGRLVHDLFLRRELIAIGEDIVNRAYDSNIEESAGQQMDAAEATLFSLSASGDSNDPTAPFSEALAGMFRQAEAAIARRAAGKTIGVSTGLRDLDEMTGGLHAGDLFILGGRPSMGKTDLAINIALGAAKAGVPVHFFSVEMTAQQIAARAQATLSGVSADRLRRGAMSKFDLSRARQNAALLSELPIIIDDTPGLSLSTLRSRARRVARKHLRDAEVRLIVVDHLGLLSSPAAVRAENRTQELGMFTRGMKALAKETNSCVLALCQLNRSLEQRQDKRPMLSDLRESGKIEEDADVVGFVYRESYYLARSEPTHREGETSAALVKRIEDHDRRVHAAANKIELGIAKNRMGPVGVVNLFYDHEISQVGNLAEGA